MTTYVGNMSNNMKESYNRQEVKQKKIVDDVKEALKEQKKMIDQMFKLLKKGFEGFKRVDEGLPNQRIG